MTYELEFHDARGQVVSREHAQHPSDVRATVHAAQRLREQQQSYEVLVHSRGRQIARIKRTDLR